ncbi:MAG: DUF1292 domain-containing protein [Erysipelotrichaceae bacterium]|jgi:uncharacterized protein YrzB (UPF0473 family)|nr:DUF1292 domain-containing protein [Erysipelotrichaceae bacterium]
MEDDKIYITDDTGKEYAFKILMSYDLEGKEYVIVEDPELPDQAYVFCIGENGTIETVEDPELLDIAEELIGTVNGDE